MATPALYLQPLIGFAQWHLGRGESAAAVLAMLERHPDYGALSLTNRQTAVEQALVNLLATHMATGPMATRPVVEAFGKILPTSEAVGYRIIAEVVLDNGGTKHVTVTVNAPPDMSPVDVLNAARESIDNGMYRPHSGSTAIGHVGVAGIAGVYEGGLQGPNLNLM